MQFGRYGGPEEMSFGEYELPPLEPQRVRVRVKAAAINPLDWKLRRGVMKFVTGRKFPQGMGSDFAGVVEAVGAQVKGIEVGDEVFGTAEIKRQGAFADIIDASAELVVRKPATLSFSEAACLPIPAATAWAAIVGVARASSGSRIFIHGCSGAVGSSAVQLALARGAHVSGACGASSQANVKSAGVNPVFAYSDKASFASDGLYDAVFDTLGTLPVADGLTLLKPRGRFIDINPTPGRMLRGLVSGRYKMTFSTGGFKNLEDIAKLAGDGKLRSSIGLEAPFSDALSVIKDAELGRRVAGRIVLLM
ncbi:NAD(P)-dependent alcohol dehydrogenase [Stenotrophomonas maltophilia]|nr:NAD(P)-dependent alcohol dehydrogenase [Stenotrophomonas maltophilia]MBA0468554.1 NAD(P)-dependent alcohol dehydrogenase [Stenotrophomonas maltophilia]MBA0475401.1 NAD(P)-dependent alcohol dehydrogenase [Stenotrophomonas maltophilia]MBA0484875.1 NAD(P)-dependent alcohol dehydrogenase [Stenotrophomonas maltophilia]